MTTLNMREKLRKGPIVAARPQSLREVRTLLLHSETLQQETHHRVANSLQIIASMLAMDAREPTSEEARLHLTKAHQRILAVAAVQRQIQACRAGGDLEIADYLRQLGQNLTASVLGDDTRLAIDVRADAGTVPSAVAMEMGLIVTELVINARKHAFEGETAAGEIVVTYSVVGHGWRLTVSDNGVGRPNGARDPTATGAGTGILAALVSKLDARIETGKGVNGVGTAVSVTGLLASPPRSKKEMTS